MSGHIHRPCWLDLVYDLDPSDWPAFDLARLERYLASVFARRS